MRLVVAAVVALGLGACIGAPQRKVAVLGVERASGASDRALEAWVAERVDRRYEVVPKQTYWHQANRMGAKAITARNVRRVAKRIDVDAIVYGEVSKKKRGRAWLTLWVHDGRTGKLIETHELAVKQGKVSSKQTRRLEAEILASLPPAVDADDDASRRERVRPEPARAEVVATKVDRDDAPDEESSKPAPARKPPPNKPAVAAEVRPAKVKPAAVAVVRPVKVKPVPAAKPKKPAKPVFEPAEQDPTVYDGEGQALDEEMPGILK